MRGNVDIESTAFGIGAFAIALLASGPALLAGAGTFAGWEILKRNLPCLQETDPLCISGGKEIVEAVVAVPPALQEAISPPASEASEKISKAAEDLVSTVSSASTKVVRIGSNITLILGGLLTATLGVFTSQKTIDDTLLYSIGLAFILMGFLSTATGLYRTVTLEQEPSSNTLRR